MRTDLSVHAVRQDDMRVDVHIREHVWPMEYSGLPGRFPTPMEALLASLTGCAANTLSLVLSKKMGIKVEWLEVEARAERREQRPEILTEIELLYRLRTEPVDSLVIDEAVHIAEDRLCPVLAMLRPGTSIRSEWERA